MAAPAATRTPPASPTSLQLGRRRLPDLAAVRTTSLQQPGPPPAPGNATQRLGCSVGTQAKLTTLKFSIDSLVSYQRMHAAIHSHVHVMHCTCLVWRCIWLARKLHTYNSELLSAYLQFRQRRPRPAPAFAPASATPPHAPMRPPSTPAPPLSGEVSANSRATLAAPAARRGRPPPRHDLRGRPPSAALFGSADLLQPRLSSGPRRLQLNVNSALHVRCFEPSTTTYAATRGFSDSAVTRSYALLPRRFFRDDICNDSNKLCMYTFDIIFELLQLGGSLRAASARQ